MTEFAPEAIAVRLETFLRENFQIQADDPYFNRSVNLWEEGYVDSMGVVEVIAFIEDSFSVTVPEEMLFAPEFTHIYGMANMIAELCAVAADRDS